MDREQVRRDALDRDQLRARAEHGMSDIYDWDRHDRWPPDTCLALLADLEQAERERDEALNARIGWMMKFSEAEAQLAKVPTLVEKAKRAKSQAAAPDYDEEAIRDALWAVVDDALALAVFEQEQGE